MKSTDAPRRRTVLLAALLAALPLAASAASTGGGGGGNAGGTTGGGNNGGGNGGGGSAAPANSDWTGSGWTGGKSWGDSYSGTAPAATPNSQNSNQNSSSGQSSSSGQMPGTASGPPPGMPTAPGKHGSIKKTAAEEPADDASNDGGSDDQPQALTLADARENFTTVVTSHVDRLSDGGSWTWREKGKTWKLTLVSVNESSVRKKGAGSYAGLAVLRDVRTRKKLSLEFTVDFSKPVWAVTSVKRPAQPR